MTLITEMMSRPLDPGYAAAASTREAAGLPPSTGHRSPLLIASAVLIGVLLATAAVALRAPETTVSRAKAELVSQIEERRTRDDAQTKRIAALRAEIDAAQATSLRLQSQGGLADRLAGIEFATGAVAATGPGLTLTLDDAERPEGSQNPDVDPRTGAASDEGRVIARDLQIIVNGLWESGAEAVAVNGHRLTARSAIRFAGQAILVDYRPLVRPYVVTAIGDPERLGVDFAESDGGSYLQSLRNNYKIRVDIRDSPSLTLPGAPSLTIREAKPVPPAASPALSTPPSTPPSPTTSPAIPKDTP